MMTYTLDEAVDRAEKLKERIAAIKAEVTACPRCQEWNAMDLSSRCPHHDKMMLDALSAQQGMKS